MGKKTIILGGRCNGKDKMMWDQLNALMDDNPKAVAVLVRADGSREVFENAEFVVLEKPVLNESNLEVKI